MAMQEAAKEAEVEAPAAAAVVRPDPQEAARQMPVGQMPEVQMPAGQMPVVNRPVAERRVMPAAEDQDIRTILQNRLAPSIGAGVSRPIIAENRCLARGKNS